MNFVHCFWTKPLFEKKFGDFKTNLIINIVDFAQSVEYIHREGHTIELYTDKKGLEVFKYIPYDKVTVIENTITNNSHLAASFKFETLKRMSLDDILIDGDIFLQNKQVIDIIENSKDDVLVSCFEDRLHFTVNSYDVLDTVRPFNFQGIYATPEYENCDGWHNTSVMKFTNELLKKEYIAQYLYHAKLLLEKNFGNIWPDIIIELYHLGQLCKNKGYTIGVIIPDFNNNRKMAIDVGFCHLGDVKETLHNYNAISLERMNYPLAKKLQENINKLIFKYQNVVNARAASN